MKEHHFTLSGTWTRGILGTGEISVGNLKSRTSVPTNMGGPGEGTNPEELLVGASATCYLITLAAILERREIPVERIEIKSEGIVEVDLPRLKFTRILHRPLVKLRTEATEAHEALVKEQFGRAEQACLISNAVRGNVEVIVEGMVAR